MSAETIAFVCATACRLRYLLFWAGRGPEERKPFVENEWI